MAPLVALAFLAVTWAQEEKELGLSSLPDQERRLSWEHRRRLPEPPGALPVMPTHFSTTITANFFKASVHWENATLHQREFYDFASNRYHTITRSAKGVHRTLHNMALNAMWVWEGDSPHEPRNCTMVLSSNANSTRRIANATGHIRPSYQLLNFAGPGRKEVYQGQEEVNGLLTDVWAAEESFLSPRTRQFVNWTTTYYWTARSWRTADGSATVPVRAVVEGAHGFTGRSFSHTYEFSSFLSGVVDSRHFEPPRRCDTTAYCDPMAALVKEEEVNHYGDAHKLYRKSCFDNDDGDDDDDSDGDGDGDDGKTSAGVVGVLVGALLGAAGLTLFQRWQRRKSDGGLAEQMAASDGERQQAIQMAAI